MSFFVQSLKKASFVTAAGLVAAALTVSASAGVPALEFDVSVSNGFNSTFNPAGADLGGGVFNFQGAIVNPDFVISWDLNAQPDTSPFGQLQSNFTFESFTDATLDFTIVLTLPMNSTTAATQYSGSSSWTLTGIDGTLATLTATPLWQAQIDGVTVDSLYPDPNGISFAGPGGGDLSSAPIAGLTAGLNDSIGIVLSFSLSGQDTATTSGVLNVIPGPGALAMLGLGLLGVRRRRR